MRVPRKRAAQGKPSLQGPDSERGMSQDSLANEESMTMLGLAASMWSPLDNDAYDQRMKAQRALLHGEYRRRDEEESVEERRREWRKRAILTTEMTCVALRAKT